MDIAFKFPGLPAHKWEDIAYTLVDAEALLQGRIRLTSPEAINRWSDRMISHAEYLEFAAKMVRVAEAMLIEEHPPSPTQQDS